MIDDDTVFQMTMDLVRLCRNHRNAHGVWRDMQALYPEYDIEAIKKAMTPVIRRMADVNE
ncbi:hypothetical protein [Pluralibacter gergoviae]|uniref:hypothetical protein n=1 Tax=Pluralibacter gergoviae TaxID=61647 RepID=UPI001FF55340|nr:hypothetical protein [Pluralibacter gergoviae]MCK1065028.1 hypothetical protein [Pluralibacter gergoviae]